MQPFHFEAFSTNYAVLIGVVILGTLLWRPLSNRALLRIAVLCLFWGLTEVSLVALARSASDVMNDQTIPVLLRLEELAKQDGSLAVLRAEGKTPGLVFSPHVEVMGSLPTWAPQGTLLGSGALDFGSASQRERIELFYLHLYYCQTDPERFRKFLNESSEDSSMNFYARSLVFGDERIVPMLTPHFRAIQDAEIEREVRAYQGYMDSFSREKVLQHRLMYVVTRANKEPDLSHIDRWYERDAGERVEAYNLYRLKLRQ